MVRTLKEAQALSNPIRFPPDNEAKYFMDFSFWKGLPSDRDFYDVGVAKGDSRELVALGYGAQGRLRQRLNLHSVKVHSYIRGAVVRDIDLYDQNWWLWYAKWFLIGVAACAMLFGVLWATA